MQDRPSRIATASIYRAGAWLKGSRALAQETPVALTYQGSTYAVMMASPADLENFALGFSITEGLVASADEIISLEVAHLDNGLELRMWLADQRAEIFQARQRHLAGPTGCGLCGIESLDQALRLLPQVSAGQKIMGHDVIAALRALPAMQQLNRETASVHAAGFWDGQKLAFVREDVGRHNALDKLCGAMVQANCDPAAGLIVLSSRISVEMVQKAAMMGGCIVAGISAPTALAVDVAQSCNITLVGIARDDGFEVFTQPFRIVDGDTHE